MFSESVIALDVSIAQNVSDRARFRAAKPLQIATSRTSVGVPLSAIFESSSANALSETVSNELPSTERMSSNSRILIPDPEVSTLKGHVLGSEYNLMTQLIMVPLVMFLYHLNWIWFKDTSWNISVVGW